MRLSGKAFRVFGAIGSRECSGNPAASRRMQSGIGGCVLQWLSPIDQVEARSEAVGLDLGLKTAVTTSDGEKLETGRFYRNIEVKIAKVQRAATSSRRNEC